MAEVCVIETVAMLIMNQFLEHFELNPDSKNFTSISRRITVL